MNGSDSGSTPSCTVGTQTSFTIRCKSRSVCLHACDNARNGRPTIHYAHRETSQGAMNKRTIKKAQRYNPAVNQCPPSPARRCPRFSCGLAAISGRLPARLSALPKIKVLNLTRRELKPTKPSTFSATSNMLAPLQLTRVQLHARRRATTTTMNGTIATRLGVSTPRDARGARRKLLAISKHMLPAEIRNYCARQCPKGLLMGRR